MIVLHLAPFSQGLILALVLVGVYGLFNTELREGLVLDVRRVAGGEFYRLVSSSFVHANWAALVIHIAVLATIAPLVELRLGAEALLAVYAAGILAGSLWLVLENWRRQDARALGAAGASAALVTAFLLLAPTLQLKQVAWMPAIVAAGAFVGFSAYGAVRWRRETGGFAVLIGGVLAALAIVCVAWPDRVRQLPDRVAESFAPPPSTIDKITITPDD